jgi:hypothetical protein
MADPVPTKNPFATPGTDVVASVVSDHDRFIHDQVSPMLEPGEAIRYTAYMQKAPPLWFQILFMGLIVLLLIKHYLVAVTNHRIILMRTKNWWMRPKLINLGVEEIRWADVERISIGGFANNRSLEFHFRNGTSRRLRIAPHLVKFVSGQKEFFKFAEDYRAGSLQS